MKAALCMVDPVLGRYFAAEVIEGYKLQTRSVLSTVK